MNGHQRTEDHPPSESALLDVIARKIVERELSAPAIIFLESTKPLNMVGCQALNFLEPLIQSLFNIRQYNEFIQLMENRSNVEELILRIERLEKEARTAKKSESG